MIIQKSLIFVRAIKVLFHQRNSFQLSEIIYSSTDFMPLTLSYIKQSTAENYNNIYWITLGYVLIMLKRLFSLLLSLQTKKPNLTAWFLYLILC